MKRLLFLVWAATVLMACGFAAACKPREETPAFLNVGATIGPTHASTSTPDTTSTAGSENYARDKEVVCDFGWLPDYLTPMQAAAACRALLPNGLSDIGQEESETSWVDPEDPAAPECEFTMNSEFAGLGSAGLVHGFSHLVFCQTEKAATDHLYGNQRRQNLDYFDYAFDDFSAIDRELPPLGEERLAATADCYHWGLGPANDTPEECTLIRWRRGTLVATTVIMGGDIDNLNELAQQLDKNLQSEGF